MGHIQTEETKQIISEKRKKYLKEHPDEHPWKRHNKFKSKPCEHLKEILKNSFEFEEEYTDERWEHNYSIDIAFLDKKIGVEVNGNQHYQQSGELTNYYQKRHDYLISKCWLILEVHYANCYNNEKIEELKNAIINCKNIDLEEHKQLFENRRKHKEEKEQEKLQRYEDAKQKGLLRCDGKICGNGVSISEWIKRKETILNCGIDLTKFGWVGKVIEKTGYTKRIIENTIKRFEDEFSGKFFRRK